MKNLYNHPVGGGKPRYSAPEIEILDISIEKGFGDSDLWNYGPDGEAGSLGDGNNYEF